MLTLLGIQALYVLSPAMGIDSHQTTMGRNKLTTEGSILHSNVDNPFYRQKNGGVITLRSLHIASRELGLYGVTDAVELIPSDSREDSITHNKYKGFWKPYPIEYKRGHSKPDERDEVQLAALSSMSGRNVWYSYSSWSPLLR